MQLKLFIKVFVYTFSTLIVIIMGAIVAHNFARDGRPFEKPAVAVAKDKSVKPVPKVNVKIPTGSSGGNKSTGSNTQEDKHETYKVEVVNCTGKAEVGRSVKSTLEANGFKVVLKFSDVVKGDTVITERDSKRAGEKALELLKVGTVYEEFQKAPYFDAIIEIGIDFAP